MNKLFSVIILLTLSMGYVCLTPVYAHDGVGVQKQQAKVKFEKRLNLTDKQKEKAKVIHQKGLEKMKPVMDQIVSKRKEINSLRLSKDVEDSVKKEQLSKLHEELKVLDRQAREIRKENSQEFESILTKKQKKELEKMKSEGRKRFEKKHPPRTPFGAPDFWKQKPLFPQPSTVE